MARALKMVHESDPRQLILDATRGFVSGVKVLGARVLIATYIRPEKTQGGIIITDKSRDEDNWQGKTGLIVAMGPLAFANDADHNWGDLKPTVGDWVLTNVGDTRRLTLGANSCRFVEDVNVQAIVSDPDSAW